jgi:hypothetical protein
VLITAKSAEYVVLLTAPPVHNNHPVGAVPVPHILITPVGDPLACTKAVVASWVELFPIAAVGAVGVPVNVGDTEEIAPENNAVDPDRAPVIAVAPVKVEVPPTVKLPFTLKLPAEPVWEEKKLVPSQ